jgi:Short C-terminal domain
MCGDKIMSQVRENIVPEQEGFLAKRKRLLSETARAFRAELHGQKYSSGGKANAQQVPSGSGNLAPLDKYDQIAKLNELRTAGALTEEEFQQEKAKLLGAQ